MSAVIYPSKPETCITAGDRAKWESYRIDLQRRSGVGKTEITAMALAIPGTGMLRASCENASLLNATFQGSKFALELLGLRILSLRIVKVHYTRRFLCSS